VLYHNYCGELSFDRATLEAKKLTRMWSNNWMLCRQHVQPSSIGSFYIRIESSWLFCDSHHIDFGKITWLSRFESLNIYMGQNMSATALQFAQSRIT